MCSVGSHAIWCGLLSARSSATISQPWCAHSCWQQLVIKRWLLVNAVHGLAQEGWQGELARQAVYRVSLHHRARHAVRGCASQVHVCRSRPRGECAAADVQIFGQVFGKLRESPRETCAGSCGPTGGVVRRAVVRHLASASGVTCCVFKSTTWIPCSRQPLSTTTRE